MIDHLLIKRQVEVPENEESQFGLVAGSDAINDVNRSIIA